MTDNELYHHGILGMKWGIRRFQNSDGSLTSLGQSHRDVRESRFDFDSLKKSATDFINANKGKSFSEMKIDALDYMNQKGVMDLFDANADAPFSAIKSGEGESGRRQREISNYRGKGSDPFSFVNKLSRLMDYTTDTIDVKEKKSREFIHEFEGALIKETITGSGRDAKIDYEYEKLQSTEHHENPFAGRDRKQTYQDRFDRGMERGNFSYTDWGKEIIERTGRGVEDKKLGMISKDARDIERETVGKTFVDSLRTSGDAENTHGTYDIGKLTDTYYKTSGRNADVTPFAGKMYEKGETYTFASGQTIELAGAPTKEYVDYMGSLTMPSNYSHVTDTPAHDFVDTTSSMLKDKWTMSHDDLTEDFLAHHGIMGMHWGERKYQNTDGSLTEEGRRHYGVGPAREFAKKIGDTAKRAGEAVSTAARKTFKPTSEDMDEKLAKAYEKQAIKDKKNELRALKGHNKKMKDMSDQEVWQEIQSRNNRKTLEQMRNDASTIRQGGKFVAGMASTAAKPIGALAKMGAEVALDSAKYGLTRAARSAIDDAIENASKKRRLENRTDSEKLRDEANDVRNKTDIQRMESENRMRSLKDETEARRMMSENRMRDARDTNELHRMQAEENLRSTKTSYEKAKMENDIDRFASETSLREAKNASERTKAQRDAAVNFLEYQTAMGSEGSSTYSAERLQRLKNNRVSDDKNKNKNKNKNQNKS